MAQSPTKTVDLPPVRKTPTMLKIEHEMGQDIRLVIKELYDMYGSISRVAQELGLDTSVISIWCARLGITLKHRPVAEIANAPGKPEPIIA